MQLTMKPLASYGPFTTRIAPSPTGDMHLGTARTAYFNWLIARASDGQFILRIDDTDLERNKEEHVTVITETLTWLGLQNDGAFRQSSRNAVYQGILRDIQSVGATITLANGAIALRCPDDLPPFFQDAAAGRIAITQTNKDQIHERLILARGGDKVGQVTYQFASAVDDYLGGVNFICRGTDHISNTPKQIAIWKWLQKTNTVAHHEVPLFAHVGLIMKDGKKMSKRDGAASMLYYKQQGYNPDAVLNFMLRLGWGPSKDDASNAIINRDKAITMFLTDGKMRSTNAGFDQKKLDWFNKAYQ